MAIRAGRLWGVLTVRAFTGQVDAGREQCQKCTSVTVFIATAFRN
jgi:hypothetical protein